MSSHVDVAQIVDLKSSAKASDLFYLNGNDRFDQYVSSYPMLDFFGSWIRFQPAAYGCLLVERHGSLLMLVCMSSHVDVAQIVDLKSSASLDRGFVFSLLLSDVFWLNDMDRFDNTCLVILSVVYKLGSSPSSLISKHEHMSYLVDVAQIVDLIKCKALDLF
nr:hypothetical protein Iba_chr02fCG11300 [Ipomoea batatas]